MNFVVNQGKLEEVAKKCEDVASNIEEKISAIYEKIGKIETDEHWVGDSYTAFSESCEKYHESLNQLVNILKAYAVLLRGVDTPRQTLESSIKKALNG